MKTFMSIIASVLVMTSCAKPVEVEKTENYQVEPFTCISMSGVGNIIYTQGDYCFRAEGDSSLIARTEITYKDGCLYIDQKKGQETKNSVNFYISAPTLTKVESQGVGTFEAKKSVVFDNDFKFESDGVGSVRISDLTCQNFKFHQEGVGASNVKVKCQKATFESEGVGACDLEIEADTLHITSDGVGAVKVKGHVKHYTSDKGGFVSKISDKKLVVGE